VDAGDAAFATIGAIALHGVRQAEARLGETVVVIGLGLLGQLTVQLLVASGCRVIGVDVEPWKLELARKAGAARALLRSDDVVAHTLDATRGRGADAVIITAATANNDPFVLAGELARDRAHVVLVGAVPIEIPRSPYYEKELDVRLSRSYGPGRYDAQYEEKGLDYPIGYVRWTEQRNMEAFLDAVASKRVKLDGLVTHRFALDDAERAYDVLARGGERLLAIALAYPARPAPPPRATIATTGADPVVAPRGAVRLGLVGAGSFAGGTLIPLLRDLRGVSLATVCTASGLSARDAAVRHAFAASTSDPDAIFADPAINAVVIATRHDSHAALARAALDHGKAVFVEKPLALDRDELADVIAAAQRNPALVVGFNRRFSPHTERVRRAFAGRAGALVITIRVNAGAIPATSWIHDPELGGGRLLGEACHFVDLAGALAGAPPRRVHAVGLGSADPASRLRDNVAITIEYGDGSIATIVYTSKGDPALGKERIEVFGDATAAVIDDFHTSTITRGGRVDRLRTKQDKGHRDLLVRFAALVAIGGAPPIPLAALEASTSATLAALESLALGAPIEV
ncbi:MAG TPA: bi-domain-containing oxidoreductase, partial [Kofleriaceae bacterium]|nr:bi-domain-containing oxidoreductase [Kofleriaceae bacterium]